MNVILEGRNMSLIDQKNYLNTYPSIDYGEFSPSQIYQMVKTASDQTIREITPKLNPTQIEFITEMLHNPHKKDLILDIWNQIYKPKS